VARLAFLGTPDLAVVTLEALIDAGHELALVLSRPDVRRGRGASSSPSPVKRAALERGLRVSDSLEDLSDLDLDAAVVVAYGRLIPTDLLEQLLMVNLHFSLLPRWRGAAPLERAILAGDAETGVCLMKVEPELDAGGVYASYATELDDKTLDELRRELSEAGTALLVDRLVGGVRGLGEPVAQEGEVSYAKKLRSEELELRFDEPAELLRRIVRLGRAYTFFDGRRLRVLAASLGPALVAEPGSLEGCSVACSGGSLELLEVQPEGGRAMEASAWVRGLRHGGSLRLGRSEGP
jgi:methionyl-tRNA formyltransferase